MMIRALCLAPLLIAVCFAGLDQVMAEQNLEKRSELALKNAHAALDGARQAFKDGDLGAEAKALEEVGRSVELSKQSLDQSGKNPRRSPKYFKKAEIEVRKLIRRLDSFRLEMSVDDRGPVDKLIDFSHKVHEDLIAGIMGKKPKQ
jgi:hypothetical protein